MKIEIRQENQVLFDTHPRYWEFILVVDQLERPLQALCVPNTEAEALAPQARLSYPASAEWALERLHATEAAVRALQRTFKELTTALGEPGKPGDPSGIVFACRLIVSHCQTLLQVEREIIHTPLHSDLQDLQLKWSGMAADNIRKISGMVAQLRDAAENERTDPLNIELVFSAEHIEDWELGTSAKATSMHGRTAPRTKTAGCGCLMLSGLFLIALVVIMVAPLWGILIFLGVCVVIAHKF